MGSRVGAGSSSSHVPSASRPSSCSGDQMWRRQSRPNGELARQSERRLDMLLLRAAFAAVVILVAIPSLAQDTPTPAPNPWFEVSFGYQGKVPVGTASSKSTSSFGASFGWVSRGPSLGLVVLC